MVLNRIFFIGENIHHTIIFRFYTFIFRHYTFIFFDVKY